MTDLISYLQRESQKWPGVKVSYRDSWECDYFEVASKGFCMLGKNKEGELVMTVKGLPEQNEVLREQYESVVPGYYANKTHWNSFKLEGSPFTDEELLANLQQSYQLVFNKLTKKVRESLLS